MDLLWPSFRITMCKSFSRLSYIYIYIYTYIYTMYLLTRPSEWIFNPKRIFFLISKYFLMYIFLYFYGRKFGTCWTSEKKIQPRSEWVSSLGIMNDQSRTPLKPLNTIVLWWSERFQGHCCSPWCRRRQSLTRSIAAVFPSQTLPNLYRTKY